MATLTPFAGASRSTASTSSESAAPVHLEDLGRHRDGPAMWAAQVLEATPARVGVRARCPAHGRRRRASWHAVVSLRTAARVGRAATAHRFLGPGARTQAPTPRARYGACVTCARNIGTWARASGAPGARARKATATISARAGARPAGVAPGAAGLNQWRESRGGLGAGPRPSRRPARAARRRVAPRRRESRERRRALDVIKPRG